MATVVVGLSGGVDSSVAAHILKEQGHHVIGLFMRNWNDESVIIDNECPWIEDSNDALQVAESLSIPFQVLDFSKEYKERIVDYMFKEYENGRTPNPDVLCNREVKFDLFLKKALELGADYVATGHYCRKETSTENGRETHRLLAGKDGTKDQSYFLCQVNQEQLSKALFPIGDLKKTEVRALAKKIGLNTAEKKDSQGLCFIGKVKLPVFLQQQLKPKKGKVIEIDSNHKTFKFYNNPHSAYALDSSMGKIVGEHEGAHYFTIGQRKGLNIGGTPLPLFIIGTNTTENVIYVGQGEDHPGLFRKGLTVKNDDVHWLREDLKLQEEESDDYLCRIRYRQALTEANLIQKNNELLITFNKPQRGITPGQFVAWYKNDELIGSGVIN
ncbi:MAG: tRNA 2-thiouridine(34) synthase MnmA [Bacteroidota bacterium]|nr:tRNA 2-thiouridine(34) synthase MnmA [Bacteroidota bacterium]